jgi:hypothetical protein
VYEAVATPPFSGSPIGFAFLPDGRILLIEKQGRVRIVPVGSLISTSILLVPNVDSLGGEEGLLGLAVDPDWPTRPYVYFCYTRTDSVTCVTMYTASGQLTNPTSTNLVLADPFHLLTDIPNIDDEHNAGTLRFGPDGMLFLSLGDDKNSCEGPQSLHILSGKILRLDVSQMPGVGTGPPPKADITPPDNPFPGPNENEKLVWAWGLRNPYRFTIDPSTNDLFIGDVGRDAFEELDRSDWKSGGGENYGWPELEALAPTGFPCDSVNVWTDPIFAYPHGDALPHVIIAGPRYRVDGGAPDAYPAVYDGSVFVLEFYHGWISRLVEGAGGWEIAAPVPGQPTGAHWAEGLDNSSDFQQGPDGSLYFCHVFLEPRGIYRIRWTHATGVAAAPALGSRLRVVPNPVRAGRAATIRWDLAEGAMRSLTIVDVAGRTVSALRETASGGVVWDARGRDGRPLPAGVYFVRFESDDGRSLRTKVSVVR